MHIQSSSVLCKDDEKIVSVYKQSDFSEEAQRLISKGFYVMGRWWGKPAIIFDTIKGCRIMCTSLIDSHFEDYLLEAIHVLRDLPVSEGVKDKIEMRFPDCTITVGRRGYNNLMYIKQYISSDGYEHSIQGTYWNEQGNYVVEKEAIR